MNLILAIQLFDTFSERFTHSVVLMLVGMLVVFFALSIVGVLLAALNRWFSEKPKPAPVHVPSKPAVAAMTGPVAEPGIGAHTLVVISAAVAAALGAGARVTKVRTLTPDRSGTAWASQGRVDIHSSHAFGKRH
ncbi:MAG: OadG family protein [Phycisphaeraceae bacterium]